MTDTQQSPTAAGSGASATESFLTTEMYEAARQVPPERVDAVVRAVLDGVHSAIREHEVTYPEFQAAKAWLIQVGEGGEWPLFLDVFVEHVVEEVQAETQQGTKGTILGPYYLPGQERLTSPATLPMREDEKGSHLVFAGQVRDVDTLDEPEPVADQPAERDTGQRHVPDAVPEQAQPALHEIRPHHGGGEADQQGGQERALHEGVAQHADQLVHDHGSHLRPVVGVSASAPSSCGCTWSWSAPPCSCVGEGGTPSCTTAPWRSTTARRTRGARAPSSCRTTS